MSSTPEHIYDIYHRECFFRARGIRPRPMVNFDKPRAREDWTFVKRLAEMADNSNGHLDPELYISTLAEFYKGFFPLERLVHISSIKIYRTIVERDNNTVDIGKIKKLVAFNIDFVSKYCADQGILSFREYARRDLDLVPTMAVHLGSGRVSVYFLALVQDIEDVLSEYPADVRDEYFQDFLRRREAVRRQVLADGTLRMLSDNLGRVIEMKIKEMKGQANERA